MSEKPEPGDEVSGVDASNGADRHGIYVKDDQFGTAIVRSTTGQLHFVSADTMRITQNATHDER